MPRLTLMLPCFNEEQSLPALLTQAEALRRRLMPDWDLDVMVVDDGSSDGSAAAARSGPPTLPVELVSHAQNRGLGSALATGISAFLSHGDGMLPAAVARDVIVVMDADGTHPLTLIPALLAAHEAGPADVVIASRYAPGGSEDGLSSARLFYSRTASRVLRLLAPIHGVRDYTCGFRLYARKALKEAAAHFGDGLITERGFTCMAELLIKLARRGSRCVEVPLELHYELKLGPSKMNVAATIRRYAAMSLRILFDRRYR